MWSEAWKQRAFLDWRGRWEIRPGRPHERSGLREAGKLTHRIGNFRNRAKFRCQRVGVLEPVGKTAGRILCNFGADRLMWMRSVRWNVDFPPVKRALSKLSVENSVFPWVFWMSPLLVSAGRNPLQGFGNRMLDLAGLFVQNSGRCILV